jgi:hypothetical protein
MSYREYKTTAGSVIPKGRVGCGICNSWFKQPLGLWCWGIPLLAVDLMLRWAGEKLRSGACRGIWCYAGKMPTRWVSGWLWVKCTTSAECKSIRIAESSVMDGWKDHYIAQCSFGVKKWFSEKWRKVPDEVLGGYCRGTVMVQSTCRVLPRQWRWSCVIDLFFIKEGGHVWLTTDSLLEIKWVSPFPRDFY